MVVMWNEKPMLSSLSNRRVLSQVPVLLWTLRSVCSHSARVLTIISNTSGSLVFGLLAHHGSEGRVENGECPVDLLFADDQRAETRSEERRGGEECVSPCGFRWSPAHIKKK